MSRFDKARVAEVLVQRGGETSYGSGYRISSRLVLTVGHLLDGDGTLSCSVLLGGGEVALSATPRWRAADQDLALLQLDSGAAAGGAVQPVAFGGLPDADGRVAFMGIGFPGYALRPETAEVSGLRRRDSRRVEGFVQLGSNLKSGLLDLTVTSAPPRDRTKDPWKGMSGAAFFTEDGRLLIGVQAQRLPDAGTGSSEAEPIARALQDPQFEELLLDDGVPTLPVQIPPPGTPSPKPLRAVIPQQELVEGFSDFKQNLRSDQLSFVSPGDDHPANPKQLFRKLLKSDARGVLLVGAAGTGKTRTGIEVGQEALKVGWRVLHVVPGDDRGVINELIEQVLVESGPVLVVVDYLNESQLDPLLLRHRLISEARRNNIMVAVLASVRPGWLQKADRARLHEFFDEVELRQDDSFQHLVTENALQNLAPTAIRQLGLPRMMEVSGHRPIIALLIAHEIERRVKAGISLPEAAALRAGHLSAWLESRLREDGLTVPGRVDHFEPARPPGLLAAATAAAACPQALPEVTAAAHASLVKAAGTTPKAEDVVATLVSFGWLEQHNGALMVAHDVVADQLMESVLFPEIGSRPDKDWIGAMLAGCLTNPRTIGRFAVNVGRLANDLELAERSEAVTPLLDSWFVANAADIGQVLRRSSDAGGYALGAICSGAPWSGSAVRCWEQVVNPWLREFGADAEARHLLYRGLRHLPPNGALLLVPTALSWLKAHRRLREASYVLDPLLARTDLPPDAVKEVVAHTLSWLDRHPNLSNGRFVLRPLLTRADLSPKDAQRAVSTGLAWAERHASAVDGRFVLRSLLTRTDLDHGDSARAVCATLTWLDQYAVSPDARSVLRPLLTRTGLSPDDSARAVSATLTWLEKHATSRDAHLVLWPLLTRTDLDHRDSARAVCATLTWLEKHTTSSETRSVLRRLLSRPDLSPEHSRLALARAHVWLNSHAVEWDAQFVLRLLLSRTDLSPAESQGVMVPVFVWLDLHPAEWDARFVLGPLLSRPDLSPEAARRAVSAALAWLDRHAGAEDARFVLRPLLHRADLGPRDTERAARAASDWLARHSAATDSPILLGRLVELGHSAPTNALPRYELAIRTPHSPPMPPGLAANEVEIPWDPGAEADPKSATLEALRASRLVPSDVSAQIVFIAPPGVMALAPYAAVVGYSHRWVDAYADGGVLRLAGSEPNAEATDEVAKPDVFLHWAQLGGPRVDGMLTLPFPSDSEGRLDEPAAGAVRYASRLRMVPPDATSAALRMLNRVGALRTRRKIWRLPVLSTGTEPLPVGKSTPGQGVDLELIRQAAEQFRKEEVKGSEIVEAITALPVPPLDQRIAEANAADPVTLLRRLGATTDDGLSWTCPRDRGDHANIVLRVRGGARTSCKRCYPKAVGLVRLAMDTLLLTPDEAAAFILDDSGARFPTPGVAVTAHVVGSEGDTYRCTVSDPVTGRAHEAILPGRELRELRRSGPTPRLAEGDIVVALVLEPKGSTWPGRQPTGADGALVLSLTARALVGRVLAGFVPELTTGDVAIVGIARAPGVRTKVVVAYTRPANSVRGPFIGKNAERNEGCQRMLSGGITNEKIEIIPYSGDQLTLLTNALAHTQPTGILIDGRRAVVAVPPHQFRRAVGRDGLNALLAGQLTGMYVKIVHSGTDLRSAMESISDEN